MNSAFDFGLWKLGFFMFIKRFEKNGIYVDNMIWLRLLLHKVVIIRQTWKTCVPYLYICCNRI